MKTSILTLLAILIVFSVKAQKQSPENIDTKQAWETIQKFNNDSNFVILDVRTPDEFASGYIENAILIDFKSTDFEDKIKELDKTKTYLVYCKAGGRSAKAIEIMKKLGFENIFHLFQGFEVWKNEGYSVFKE